jgi:hypothetical protein
VFTLQPGYCCSAPGESNPDSSTCGAKHTKRIAARHGNGIQKKQHQIQRRLIACVPDYDKYNSSMEHAGSSGGPGGARQVLHDKTRAQAADGRSLATADQTGGNWAERV